MAKRKFHIAFLMGMLVSFCLAGDSIDYIPRISYVDGDVSLQERGSTGWTTVDVNLPIQIGDRLVLDQNGLIEIEIDDGSFLRVNQFSEFMFQKLEKDRIVIELVRGEVIARTTDAADYVLLTAAGDVVLRSEGLYRINARDDRSVELIVRSGKARFVNDKLDKKLGRNERIVVYGLSDQFVMGGGDRFDDFDNWSDRRDSRYASASESYRYIPRTVYTGAADLDLYGRWVFVADYGHCWIPTVYYSGWAPYRSGYWRYSPVWGYTWISYDPWGWLPYHYGSWAFTGPFGWVWVPGSSWGCSWWAPGRVHWGFWNGYVGWVPCGPGDYYYGYWRNAGEWHRDWRQVAVDDAQRGRVDRMGVHDAVNVPPGAIDRCVHRRLRGRFELTIYQVAVDVDHSDATWIQPFVGNAARGHAYQPSLRIARRDVAAGAATQAKPVRIERNLENQRAEFFEQHRRPFRPGCMARCLSRPEYSRKGEACQTRPLWTDERTVTSAVCAVTPFSPIACTLEPDRVAS